MIPSAALGFELRAVLYHRGELPLVPGRKYCIDIVGQPNTFRITTHPGNLMEGEFLMDGRIVSDRCLDATIIEYEPDDCPSPRHATSARTWREQRCNSLSMFLTTWTSTARPSPVP
ncbi:MAG: hypothetical protein ACUVXJ_03020 [Phycisphaerae bacterium]